MHFNKKKWLTKTFISAFWVLFFCMQVCQRLSTVRLHEYTVFLLLCNSNLFLVLKPGYTYFIWLLNIQKNCFYKERRKKQYRDSPTTSRLKLTGCPQSKSSPLFRAISNPRESSWLILSIFTEQSPSGIRPKRDVRPWKSRLTWSLSSLLKAVLRRGKKRPPPLNLRRTSTLSFLPRRGWGARGVKEQGITTQEPTRAWTWSGTEGTGETAWTLLHRAAAGIENRKWFTNTLDLM